MEYCALELVYGQRRGIGATLCASRLLTTTAKALQWRGGAFPENGKKRERSIVSIDSAKLAGILQPGEDERLDHLKVVLRLLRYDHRRAPAAVAALTHKALKPEMELLMRFLNEVLKQRYGHGLQKQVLQAFSLQLLLRTHHAAGLALTTTTRWPGTWVDSRSRGPGYFGYRPTRSAQTALVAWRIIEGYWPSPTSGLANWWKAKRLSIEDRT